MLTPNQKKTTTLATVLLIAVLIIGLSLAYFNRQKNAQNKVSSSSQATSTSPFLSPRPLPESFPIDLPKDPGDQVLISFQQTLSDRNVYTRTYLTAQSVDQVYAAMQKYFKASKIFTLTTNNNQPTFKMLSAKAGDSFLNLVVQTDAKTNKTRVDLTYSFK